MRNLPACPSLLHFLFFPDNSRIPGNRWALDQAKRNLVEKYLVVGITEEILEFVTLLEVTLPRIFKGATKILNTGEKMWIYFTSKLRMLEVTPLLWGQKSYKKGARWGGRGELRFPFLHKPVLSIISWATCGWTISVGQFFGRARQTSKVPMACLWGRPFSYKVETSIMQRAFATHIYLFFVLFCFLVFVT